MAGSMTRDCYVVWDKAKCEKAAKYIAKDGIGTPYHFKGYLGSFATIGGYGITRYNGGTVINDKWYQGINRPLPIIHEDFEIVKRPSWGWQIKKK